MHRLSVLAIVFLLLTVSSSLAQDVRYNFDKNADFSKFKTYKWVPIKGATQLDDIVDKQIKAAMDTQLTQKGLSKVEGDNADFYAGYQTAVGQEKQFTSYSTDWGYGAGWYGGGWYRGGYGVSGMSTTTGQTSTIYTGQLAVDMYNSATHTLVWRGVVSKTLDTKAKPEKRDKNLAKAAKKLFKNYPPGIKQ